MARVSNLSHAARRIGLNAHLLSLTQTYRGAGINGYIYQLLDHLPAADGALQYTAYLHNTAFSPPPEMSVCRSRWDTRSPWRRIVWEQTRLAAHSRHLDLLHGLAFATPLAAACPTVVTVHDLSFLRYPDAFRPFNRLYLGFVTRLSTRRAARVIAVSESTRQDVIRLCGAPEERVIVVPNGVTGDFSPADPAAVADFRRQKGLPPRFILFLGTLEPRKNLVRLIDAYAQWRRASNEAIKLMIAGGKGWFYERVFERVTELGLADDVIFPGFVPGEELPWFYRAAELFVYPSLFEGFGLPVLEAMACGTPTITSTASALPEVAGDAALLVDPEDTDGLAEAIGRVLADPLLAARLRDAGPRRATSFSWPRTAAATADVYRDVLSRQGGLA
ncbi:MAG: glycosyltransferase family 1 protein [Chloroflexi bacterium HGW-Chloroflexi-1]|nr:MAG: glycosyltransferase family 1 protein [Chloroflexi bacterium HGW-Chloroflexi-1]